MDLFLNKILNMDCREALKLLPDNSVHLVITSPPYGNLRKYSDNKNDLSNLDIFTQFDELINIFKETYRVLHPGRKFILFFSDLYNKTRENGVEIISPTVYLAPRILDLGFIIKNIFVWRKPGSWSNMGPGGTAPYPPSPVIQSYFEYIFVFQKKGKADYSYVTDEIRKQSAFPIKIITKESGVFTDPPDESKKLHPAPFPKSLIKKLIMMFSFINDTVLDPFAGSGTVAVSAKELKRNFIMIELNEGYCEIMRKRLENTFDLWNDIKYQIKILKIHGGKTQIEFSNFENNNKLKIRR